MIIKRDMKVKKRKRGDMKEKRKREDKISKNIDLSKEDVEEQEENDDVDCDAAAIQADNNTQVKSILVNERHQVGRCVILQILHVALCLFLH